MITNLQEAYVIHAKAYKETSMLVTFFTKNDGKVSAIAKGAKRPKSKFSGTLEPFQKITIDYSGRTSLKTLKSSECIEPFKEFCTRKNLYSAFYVNELINCMVKSNEDPIEIFNLYEQCIIQLYEDSDTNKVLRNFEFNMMKVLGYEINFHSDYKSGAALDADSFYTYAPQMGFTVSDSGYGGDQLIEIREKKFSKKNLELAKQIIKQTLDFYFEELNINSRSFFR